MVAILVDRIKRSRNPVRLQSTQRGHIHVLFSLLIISCVLAFHMRRTQDHCLVILILLRVSVQDHGSLESLIKFSGIVTTKKEAMSSASPAVNRKKLGDGLYLCWFHYITFISCGTHTMLVPTPGK